MGTRPYIIVREAGEVIFQNNELKDLRKDATNPPPGVLGKWTGKLKLMGELRGQAWPGAGGSQEVQRTEKSMKICALCVAAACLCRSTFRLFARCAELLFLRGGTKFGKSECEVRENKDMLEPSGTQHIPTHKLQRPSERNRCCLTLFPILHKFLYSLNYRGRDAGKCSSS